MSSQNPMNDPENERQDDDLRFHYENEQQWAKDHPDSFAAYWAKREHDRRDERDFWRKWDARWNKGEIK